MSVGPELLYINASSIADSGANVNVPRPAVAYSDSRTQPIINRSTDYRAAIIRFQVTGLDLPIVIPTIKANQPNPNLTDMVVGMRVGWQPSGANVAAQYSPTFTCPVFWAPETQQAVPTPNSDYYWARSKQHFISKCIQPAVDFACSGLTKYVQAQAAAGGVLNGYNYYDSSNTQQTVSTSFVVYSPQFVSDLISGGRMSIVLPSYAYYDPLDAPISQIATILASNGYRSRPAGFFWIEMLVNSTLQMYLGGFSFTDRNDTNEVYPTIVPYTLNGYPEHRVTYPNLTPAASNEGYEMCTSLFCPGSQGFLLESAQAPLVVVSEFDNTDAWSPVDSLLFTSTMPINPEIASTTNFLTGTSITSGGSSNLVIPTFTDIALPLDGGPEDYLGKVTYAPSAQYRWLEFMTNQPLTSINFQLLWRNRLTDQLSPVYLKPNGSVQMKLLLQRKF